MAPSFLFSPTHNPKKNPHGIYAKPGSPLKFYTLIPNPSASSFGSVKTAGIRFVHLWCSLLDKRYFHGSRSALSNLAMGKELFQKYVHRVISGVCSTRHSSFFPPQLIQSMMIHSWEKFFKNSSPMKKSWCFMIFINNFFMLERKKMKIRNR